MGVTAFQERAEKSSGALNFDSFSLKDVGWAGIFSLLLHSGFTFFMLTQFQICSHVVRVGGPGGPAHIEAEIVTDFSGVLNSTAPLPPDSDSQPVSENVKEVETNVDIPSSPDLPRQSKRVPLLQSEPTSPEEMPSPQKAKKNAKQPVQPKVVAKKTENVSRKSIVQRFRQEREMEVKRRQLVEQFQQNQKGSGGRKGGFGSQDGVHDPALSDYEIQIKNKVRQEWIFPTAASVDQNLSAHVDLQINEQGMILEYHLTKSSGNSAYDDSVIRAITRAAPLPAPSDPVWNVIQDGISIIFSLKELQ